MCHIFHMEEYGSFAHFFHMMKWHQLSSTTTASGDVLGPSSGVDAAVEQGEACLNIMAFGKQISWTSVSGCIITITSIKED